MIPFLLLLLLLLAGERVSSQEDENLQYGFCEGAERPLYLAYINIQPWPVLLSAGESLHILAHIYLNTTISVKVIGELQQQLPIYSVKQIIKYKLFINT